MDATKPMAVYMAASRDCAGQADEIANKLRQVGVTVVSRWHDGQTKLVDPADPDIRNKILAENLKDLRACSTVVALMRDGSPKATYGEIGWALAEGREVIWIGPEKGSEDPLACIFDAHPAVLRLSSLDELFGVVSVYQTGRSVTREEQEAMLGPDAPFRLLLAKHLKREVDARAAKISASMGQGFAADLTQVGMMMAEATKALVTDGQAFDPLGHWMTVALDLLALATLGGHAALKSKAAPETTPSREEMN